MGNTGKRGLVEFHPPLVKVTAELPGDENLRDHLDELKENDGYQGSCITVSSESLNERKDVGADE